MSREDLIDRLRIACAWFEWSEPPDMIAAGQLQDAADALRDFKITESTAAALLDGYRQRGAALRGAA